MAALREEGMQAVEEFWLRGSSPESDAHLPSSCCARCKSSELLLEVVGAAHTCTCLPEIHVERRDVDLETVSGYLECTCCTNKPSLTYEVGAGPVHSSPDSTEGYSESMRSAQQGCTVV